MFWDIAVVFAFVIFVLAAYNAYRHSAARSGQFVRWLLISGVALMLLVAGWMQRGGMNS